MQQVYCCKKGNHGNTTGTGIRVSLTTCRVKEERFVSKAPSVMSTTKSGNCSMNNLQSFESSSSNYRVTFSLTLPFITICVHTIIWRLASCPRYLSIISSATLTAPIKSEEGV